MYSLGYDIGSSLVKGAIINIETGGLAAGGFYPQTEMDIISPSPGFAEQNPDTWWNNLKILTKKLLAENNIDPSLIKCIGISYQMHGLVLTDKENNLLGNSIIWCDSRAVDIGNKALKDLGEKYCLGSLLNSPGNFTASKLKWVKDNEPEKYNKINKIMLPGDYIAFKLTGEVVTSVPGLSEGIFWDFKENRVSSKVIKYFGFNSSLLPEIKPVFSVQGVLTEESAQALGLIKGIPVSYRAGDQPNNAFSLNVLNPGETAATAGTSGVLYSVTDKYVFDSKSRVNGFAHVNHSAENKRIGILLCINGTGILNSWVRKHFAGKISYEEINSIAGTSEPGSKGISILPFGNGAERILRNKNMGSHILGVDFNRHTDADIFRAGQEGIAFSFKYGFEIMRSMGIDTGVIRANSANMFLSNVFAQSLADITGAKIELYNSDGAQGAARGAAVGAGFYKSLAEAFGNLKIVNEIYPIAPHREIIADAYGLWLGRLNKFTE